jgi:hypothetical protein
LKKTNEQLTANVKKIEKKNEKLISQNEKLKTEVDELKAEKIALSEEYRELLADMNQRVQQPENVVEMNRKRFKPDNSDACTVS